MKYLSYFYIALAAFIALIILDQIWTGWISGEIAWKLLLTLGLTGGVVVIAQLVRAELVQDKKDRDDKFVD